MNTLIVGGTSGLGLELAKCCARNDEAVQYAGRTDPMIGLGTFSDYWQIDLNSNNLPWVIESMVTSLPHIDSLMYVAGFFLDGLITDVSDNQIENMLSVGSNDLVFFVKKLLAKQGHLSELITVTSTSQWVPRKHEPVYNMVKSGAALFSRAISLDERIGRTLVAAPSGMATPFYDGSDRDTSDMMHPSWVAEQIMGLRDRMNEADESFLFARILGAFGDLPNRVEIEDDL